METVAVTEQYQQTYLAIQTRLSFIPLSLVPNRIYQAWEMGGLLTPAWSPDNEAITRLWVNVCSHMTTTGVIAWSIASRLTEALEKEGSDVAEIVEAALVHDAYKRQEQAAVETAKARGLDPTEANRKAEEASIAFLLKAGINERVARLSGMTGDHGLEHFIRNTGTLAERIVFYADCCTSDDRIKTYERRFNDLKPHFKPGGRYDHVDASFLARYGKTHREQYDEVVIPIEQIIATLIGFEGDPSQLVIVLTPQSLHA